MTTLARPKAKPRKPAAQPNGASNGFPYDRLQRISVDKYHRMIASGAFTEDDPIELLEGWLVKKMPRDPKHDFCITRLQNKLIRMLSEDWIVRVQCAATTKDSEPEPDLVVARGPDDRYENHHPQGDDVALVIEVANTSIDDDRITKGRIYSRARLPIYWIVNIPERQIEVYENPRGARSAAYDEPKIYRDADRVAVVIAGKTVGHVVVRDVLPTK